MFGKLLMIILSSAFVAAALLAMRQQRLDLANEAAEVHGRIAEHDRSLWMLQQTIAEHCEAERLRRLMDEVHESWIPIRPQTPTVVMTEHALNESPGDGT